MSTHGVSSNSSCVWRADSGGTAASNAAVYPNPAYLYPVANVLGTLPIVPLCVLAVRCSTSALRFSSGRILRATFTLGAGRLRWITGLGASADFLLKAQYVNVWSDQVTYGDPGEVTTFNLSPAFSTGAQLAIGRSGWLRLEPTFRYGVLPVNDGAIEARTWSAGLQAGYCKR